jgi:hypothetical protein
MSYFLTYFIKRKNISRTVGLFLLELSSLWGGLPQPPYINRLISLGFFGMDDLTTKT